MAFAHRQLGSILLLALIFSAASAVMLLLLLETAILDQKMLNHYLEKKRVQLDYLPWLASIETQLAESFNVTASGVTVLEWVPDTLSCDETSGIRYYQITQQRAHPDGASSLFKSIYAARGARPKEMPHPNQRYCHINYVGLVQGDIEKTVNGQSSIIPLSKWLPIENRIEDLVIGNGTHGHDVRIYGLAQKKYHSGQVIVILIDEQGKAPYVEKIIDPECKLHHLLLRNNRLIVNSDEWVMVFDALSDTLLVKEKLCPMAENDMNTNGSRLNMLVRKPREAKRLILAPTSRGWMQAEVAIDQVVLGRRTWLEE